ncbi:MAG: hypothetical protein KF726_05970 [Anaerolineae bacterium]|nr:hypothetical protein [Anaerolineae bacterium]
MTDSSLSILDTDPSGTITDFHSPYLTVKWLYQRSIVLFTITGPMVLQEVIDLWASNVRRVLESWPESQRYYVVHDISKSNFGVTPHLANTIRDLYALRPQLKQSVAIVTPPNIATQLVRALVRNYEREEIRNGIFSTREEALKWLLVQVKEDGSPNLRNDA